VTVDLDAREHGLVPTYKAGCHCTACRAAVVTYMHELRRRYAAARVLIDGRLVAVEAGEHGKRTTYDNHLCRCLPCCLAATERQRELRRQQKAREDRTP
jgi:hypothetical protein